MNAQILELSRKFKELKEKHDAQSDILKQIDVEWTIIEEQLLEAMVEEGVKSINVIGCGSFTMRVENYLNVSAAAAEGFYSYLRESGNGGLLKEMVNPATLKAWLKPHFEELQQKYVDNSGLDPVEARDAALEFLKQKGCAYLTKRGVILKAK